MIDSEQSLIPEQAAKIPQFLPKPAQPSSEKRSKIVFPNIGARKSFEIEFPGKLRRRDRERRSIWF